MRHAPRPATLLLPALLVLAPVLSAQDGDEPGERSVPRTHVPDDGEVAQALRSAVALLLHDQERYVPDRPVGSIPEERFDAWRAGEIERLEGLRAEGPGVEWPYEGVYRVAPDGRIPPGYRVGGTAIVCEALLEAPGYGDDPDRRAAVERALPFLLDLIHNDEGMVAGPKRGYDVRGWGHAYALSFFLRALDLGVVPEDRREAVRDTIPHLIHCLAVNENPGGGWNYADNRSASPFMTGSTLLALYRARAAGHTLPEGLVERALDALQRGVRADTGAFAYSVPQRDATGHREAMHASSARAAVAELCLLRAGRSDATRLRRAVEGFFDGWEHLLVRKSQQGTHVGPYSIAPYYFFYGHTYAALAIEALPESDRPALRARLREFVWRTREENGGWNDRIFPRTEGYSTAMCVLALRAPELPAVPAYVSDAAQVPTGEGD